MVQKVFQALWGKFESRDELKKFGFLAFIFFCIIGTFWAIKPLKDSVFAATVGVDFLPWAKVVSIFFIVPLVIIYTKLIDTFKRQNVFYILISIYSLLAFVFYFFLADSYYGIPNEVENAWRLLGWLWYVYVDSFVSLMVALFWVIATDITLPDSARRGFPIIALFGQFGNIAGPFFLRASRFGFVNSAPIAAIAGLIMLGIGGLMWLFMNTTPKHLLQSYKGENGAGLKNKKEKSGFFEGLRLIASNWYLLGIFLMITIYEAVVVIFDFHFHAMAKAAYPQEIANAEYLAKFGVTTGIVASLCVLLGINSIQRLLGMKISLLLMPLLVMVATISLKFYPTLSVVFWIMVFAKAINYALNQPTIKQLYIPTSKNVRYKAQGWIEMFGSRGAKSVGSLFNATRGVFKSKYGAIAGINIFLTLSTTLSVGMIFVWLFIAIYVGKSYDNAVQKNEVVC
ncbi:hypothetical protein KAH94_01240 [bacterium]|nr:hypothetical protein [bacterium]